MQTEHQNWGKVTLNVVNMVVGNHLYGRPERFTLTSTGADRLGFSPLHTNLQGSKRKQEKISGERHLCGEKSLVTSGVIGQTGPTCRRLLFLHLQTLL